MQVRTLASQAGRTAIPSQKLQSVIQLQILENCDSESTSCSPKPAIQTKALDLMKLMHYDRPSLEYECSREPLPSDKTNTAQALGHYTVPAPRILHTDQRAQYVRPGWVNTPRTFRPEHAPAATAPAALFKQLFNCPECCIRGHVATECVLPLHGQKQVI